MAGVHLEGPRTGVQSTHPLAILDSNLALIGAVNAWNPRYQRNVTECFEFGDVSAYYDAAEGSGETFEVVPGNTTGQTLDCSRYDTFSKQAERAFGPEGLFDSGGQLTKDKNALTLYESWKNLPTVSGPAPDYKNCFLGVWPTQNGRTLSAVGERTVNVSAAFAWTKRRRRNVS